MRTFLQYSYDKKIPQHTFVDTVILYAAADILVSCLKEVGWAV